MIRSALALLATFYIVLCVPALVLAALLLTYGETGQGRLFASAVILGLPAPVAMWFAVYTRQKRGPLAGGACMGLSSLLLLGIVYALAPEGRPLPGSPVGSRFTGTDAYQRASVANLVPEMDQLILGTRVISTLDPLMDEPNTAELRAQVREVYGEMRRSREFECLGSVMNLAYRDLFLRRAQGGHRYEYVPAGASRGRRPVVIFLHGSLGNFRGYLWVWSRIAEERGFAIVAPTFGAGNWDAPGGAEAIEQVRLQCAADPRFDPSRVYLAGLSNGGLGVCLGAKRSPRAYRGIVFISPVIDTRELLTDEFLAAWKDKPILVLHGTSDNRVTSAAVEKAVGAMTAKGMKVERHFYEKQTHFLFFALRGQMQERIGRWLEADSLERTP